jgi:ferredoxin-nitrate reductase
VDIFLDYARRMELQDKDGNPLIKWHDAESTFGAWKECSRGHLCDYTSMSYARFQGGSGIQWPCNEQFQEGKERLCEDGIFLTDADVCQTYGHDLVTGAVVTRQEYLANDPKGKAILKPAQYVPPHEQPDGEYPLFLTTSRVVYYFHTRTKTGRAEALHQAMPDVFIQISREDADRYDISEGIWWK